MKSIQNVLKVKLVVNLFPEIGLSDITFNIALHQLIWESSFFHKQT